MARELKLVTWCDGEHEEDTPSTVVRTLTVDGGKPILLDLCETCDKAVQDVQALMDAGVPADKAIDVPESRVPVTRRRTRWDDAVEPRRTDGKDRTDCLEEGCGYVGPTRGALGLHINQKHEKKLSDYDWTP